MVRCRVDQSIERVVKDGFAFPLGVYPVEETSPKAGYTSAFEPSDGDASPGGAGGPGGDAPGEWEEWPDRYVYDILVPATRLEPLCRSLLSLLPGRIYPIVDYLGADEWREVDPYVSYDLAGMDRFLETIRRFSGFFFEDGLVGFGAMSEEPFVYMFVDEHKVVTVRVQADMKEKIEAVLHAFDLEPVEELLSADASIHEHRTVLDAPEGRRDLLNADEIMEGLRDEWRLVLNIDPESNVDEDGNDLGITGWRCIIRYDPPLVPLENKPGAAPEASSGTGTSKVAEGAAGKATPTPAAQSPDDIDEPDSPAEQAMTWPEPRYCQVFLTADSLNRAMNLAYEALEQLLQREGKTLDVDDQDDAGSPAADDDDPGQLGADFPNVPDDPPAGSRAKRGTAKGPSGQSPHGPASKFRDSFGRTSRPSDARSKKDLGGQDDDTDDPAADAQQESDPLGMGAHRGLANPEPVVIQSDRWGEGDFTREVQSVTGQKPDLTTSEVCFVEWLL